jgi:hypothetical protein|tara:strand:+ start:312 stop:959 length:648 start_codon:yes stop_codon:yes gene_type:complete
MSYFRELPNIRYPSFLKEKTSSFDYVEAKNLFRRTKLRDDLQNNFTLFEKYVIPGEARPDNVAQELYGSDQFDWVVLIVAGINNVRNEWPLNARDLYNYCLDKYGDALNSVRFFETTEVKDSSGRLILPKGKVVDSNFTIPKPGTPTATLNPVVGISNFEYETRLNDDKRSIFILRRGYLQDFVNDFREVMTYRESSEFINSKVIQTENTNITLP